MKHPFEQKTHTLNCGKRLLIRQAQPDDAQQIIDYMQAITHESDNIGWGPGEFNLTLKQELEKIEQITDSHTSIMMVAIDNDLVVACANISGSNRPRLQHTASLGISVRQSHWGLGLGRVMMTELIDWARDTDIIKQIELGVRTTNMRGIKLYLSLGFEFEYRIRRHLIIKGKACDSYAMSLLLTPHR